MGAQGHHVHLSYEAPAPAPVVVQQTPPAAPTPVAQVVMAAAPSDAAGCCVGQPCCKIAYGVSFIVMAVVAVVALILGLMGAIGFFIILGVDLIIFGIVAGTYCCVYGCCCDSKGAIIVNTTTTLPSINPVVLAMPAPPHPPIQLHYENKPQYEPSPAMGYPPVQQQQQQPPPSQATGYPPVQQQNQQPSQATGYPPVYQQQQSSQAYPPMYQQQREFAAYQPPSQAQAQEPAAYADVVQRKTKLPKGPPSCQFL